MEITIKILLPYFFFANLSLLYLEHLGCLYATVDETIHLLIINKSIPACHFHKWDCFKWWKIKWVSVGSFHLIFYNIFLNLLMFIFFLSRLVQVVTSTCSSSRQGCSLLAKLARWPVVALTHVPVIYWLITFINMINIACSL